MDFEFTLPNQEEYVSEEEGQGPRKWMDFVGPVICEVTGLEGGKSENSGNLWISTGLVVAKVDPAILERFPWAGDPTGVQLEAWRWPVTGTVKSGKSAGKPNANRFFRLVESAYTFIEKDADAAAAKAKEQQGKKIDTKKMRTFLTGKKVAVFVGTRPGEVNGEKAYFMDVKRALLKREHDAQMEGAGWKKHAAAVQAHRDAYLARIAGGEGGSSSNGVDHSASDGSGGEEGGQDVTKMF